jgi:hypothetical protein
MKPIPDKVEIVLEYPEKFYSGTFEQSSRFDAHADDNGISLTFSRVGDESERKSVRLHIHYALFAEILNELAKTVSAIPPADVRHRETLAEGASAIVAALAPAQETPATKNDRQPAKGRTSTHSLQR